LDRRGKRVTLRGFIGDIRWVVGQGIVCSDFGPHFVLWSGTGW
jgi:hypothetical protein